MRIPIVNEKDEIIGHKDRNNLNLEDIIRVSVLWVTDKEGNILLAQKSLNKKFHPGLWGPAVAGTVEEGETYEFNIIKEAEEEIGLKNTKLLIGPKVKRKTNHTYFVQWFSTVIDHNYPLIKQDNEVENIKWFTKEEIKNSLKEKPEIFLPNFEEYINIFLNENQS